MRRALVFAMLAGCYRPPALGACAFSCEHAACPDGLTCNAGDLLCHDGTAACPGTVLDSGTDAVVASDGSIDGTLGLDGSFDAPPGAFCFGSGALMGCTVTQPAQSYVLGTDAMDFGTGCDAVIGPVASFCVRVYDTMTISATLFARGGRPIVYVAKSGITVAGAIDASDGGAGAGGCTSMRRPIMNGGGGGGGRGQSGGPGGAGATSGANGGDPIASAPQELAGGCNGDDGGNGGHGGLGGGAVALISPAFVTVTGAVYAFGSGGHGGLAVTIGGGGGGGAGGTIAIHAPALDGGGFLIANGGGGGGAANDGGADGVDGSISYTSAAAIGGDGGLSASGTGGSGGNGGWLAPPTNASDGFGGSAGGGGGGGGAGVIRLEGGATGSNLTISPAPIGAF